ncbi:hypothetical protein [Piscinibacter koreensis]|nr:hypothetical protein [Schlegelella koreensis]
MRAFVQRVDLRASWERYLRIEGESTDLRLVRSTVSWICDEFAAAATPENRLGTARLVRLDVSRIADPAPELPSLQEFAASRGLEDDSEREQIAAFEEAYGSAT